MDSRGPVTVRFEDADSETELSFVVEGATPSGLALEVCDGRRFRLRAHDRRLMWARVWEHFAGVTLVAGAGEDSPGILPPIRAREARAHQDVRHWMRRFSRDLAASSLSPLRDGSWELHPVRRWLSSRRSLVSSSKHRSRCEAEVVDLFGALEDEPVRDDFYMGVWPLRRPSAPDAARVKAWRKHVRAGTLPPVLLWSISGLRVHVILDGHDRLVAAAAEGIDPPVLVLLRTAPWTPDAETRVEATAIYERQLRPPGEVAARVGMNRYLVQQFRTEHFGRPTPATWVPGLAREWDAEVTARLGDEASLLTSEDY